MLHSDGLGRAAGTAARTSSERPWLAALAVVLLAGLVRAAHLDHGAYVDELYHLLAARGWLAEGEFRIADGVYTRAAAYTVLTAWAFDLFGESLAVARLIPVLFGSLLVLAVFLWTRSVVGAVAAWVAALLLCFSPDAIMVSGFARFYALHGFLFFIGALGVYALVEQRSPLRNAALIALGSAACFALALHLQLTTVVGLLGLLVWLGLVVGLPWLVTRFAASGGGGRALIVAGLLAGAVAAGLVLGSDTGERLLSRLRSVPPWAAALKDAFWYYHAGLSAQYGSLWPLTPLAVLIGLATRPRPTLFCLLVFTPALIVHSIGAMKSMRYVYYVLPFLFVLWGIALEAVGRRLVGLVRQTGEAAAAGLGLQLRPWFTGRVLPAGLLLFVLASNAAFVESAGMMFRLERFMPVQTLPRWELAQPALEPWLEEADVVVSGSELDSLFYLGRHDVLLSRTRSAEIRDYEEFALDPRTGRPVISTAASLELLMACHADGLIVTPSRFWRAAAHIGDPLANLIVTRARALELPPDAHVTAFVWERSAAASDGRCAALERAPHPAAQAPPKDS